MKLAWSNLAKQELNELTRFSLARWGRPVAVRYLEDVRDAARRAASHPKSCRLLRHKLHILRVRSHYLILHIDPEAGRVTVARILHTAMDIERWLD